MANYNTVYLDQAALEAHLLGEENLDRVAVLNVDTDTIVDIFDTEEEALEAIVYIELNND